MNSAPQYNQAGLVMLLLTGKESSIGISIVLCCIGVMASLARGRIRGNTQ